MMVAVSSGRIGIFPGSKLPESSKLVKRCSPTVSLGFAVPFPLEGRLSSSVAVNVPKAAPTAAVEGGNNSETDVIPTPKVIIDQDSDPEATIVEVTFGDRLGPLLDTMGALKNLGLNVVKANVFLDSSGKHNKFAITKGSTGRKVEDPELLEAIRLTIINNLLQYHPESSTKLALGEALGMEPPMQKIDLDCWLTLLRSLLTLISLSNLESLTLRDCWQKQNSMSAIKIKHLLNHCSRY
ncbi:ACT-like protein [Dioscorea alata]|uniref:ACT-like protein n=1 Tax=Dioscorea alata TaxID=55571 RepID=A0ACB7UHJ4_DIOAL|nr:ACT-like protein [Dioscorea alata]